MWCRDSPSGLQRTSLHLCRAASRGKGLKQLQRGMGPARHGHDCPLYGFLSVCLQGADTHRDFTDFHLHEHVFASLHCECWRVLRFKEWVIRDSRCKALWNRGLGGFWGVFVNTATWFFFLLHFKCIVTEEKSPFLFLHQCELTQGTNTKLGLLLFKLL